MIPWPWNGRARAVLQRRAIEDLARSLALCVEPSALRASIARRVKELVGCERAVLCHWREDRHAFVSAPHPWPEAGEEGVSFPGTGTLSRWLRTNREPFLVPHPKGALEYLEGRDRQILLESGTRVCVPIFSGSRLRAILLICSPAGWKLSRDELELVMRLGQQAGLALENADLHQLERERLKGLHRAQQLAVAGQLAATVAHEVRNPLTAIRSTVQYVLQSGADWASKQRLLEESHPPPPAVNSGGLWRDVSP